MLREQHWLKYAEGLPYELMQAREEGKPIDSFEERIHKIMAMSESDPQKEMIAGQIYDDIQTLPEVNDYQYFEPSSLEEIQSARPAATGISPDSVIERDVYNKVYGAWLGRCAGCLLGQPIEGWKKERIHALLKETDNYPFQYYISSNLPEELRQKYGITDQGKVYGSNQVNWINNVSYMPEDDDTNYTIIGLKILEEYGPDFTSDDVAESWLKNLPILHVCTAERAAYRNLINGIYPPVSAIYRNPYREWIGAQIRADFFGYVTPGRPELGAELAWRDASISHVKNGIYGEMFVAAMLSAAAVCSDIETVIKAGLSQIPEKSRFYERIGNVMDWRKKGISWEQAIDNVHALYDERTFHEWCHTIPNAMIVCIGLLYGALDFEKTIGISVLGAFDTDCNGATSGSVIGMILGAQSLPEKWIAPLNDTLKSGVDGFGMVRLSELSSRTVEISVVVQSSNS